MAQLIVLYNTPANPTAFLSYYHQIHIPLAKMIPGLRSYTISDGSVQALAGNEPPFMVAVLTFDSMADLQSALVSSEGKAAADDLANFATGGATLLIYERREVV